MTRGQMAMFLWNVSGQPAATYSHGPAESPDSYYNDAVSWLSRNDITSGTSWDTFSPTNKVSRAQMATFLWKLVGVVYPGFIHDFYDVYEGAYYDQAVAWLVRAGITAGTGPGQVLSQPERHAGSNGSVPQDSDLWVDPDGVRAAWQSWLHRPRGRSSSLQLCTCCANSAVRTRWCSPPGSTLRWRRRRCPCLAWFPSTGN